jgi:hypothetical protein
MGESWEQLELERRLDVAGRILDEGWENLEWRATTLLVACGAMTLPDAQARRAARSPHGVDQPDEVVEPEGINQKPPQDRARAAQSPSATPALLERLAADEDASVRGAVARSVLSPPDVLAALWLDPILNVRIGVAANPLTPPDLLARIVKTDPVDDAAATFAYDNPALPSQTLDTLVQSRDKKAARAFSNPALPRSLLFNTASVAKDDEIAYWTSVSLAAAPEVLHRLAIRCMGIAQAESTSPRKWQKQIEILKEIAKHPSTGELTLLNLTTISGGSPVSELIRSVFDRPSVPASYWELASEARESWVRRDVAAHPGCPIEILQRLANDPDTYVRAAVHGNPHAP